MRQFLIDLLKGLEAVVPPPENCHHCITYAKYGSDDAGWEDRLALQVNQNGTFHCFFLSEGDDLAETADQVISTISNFLNSPTPPWTQLGIGPGQYS